MRTIGWIGWTIGCAEVRPAPAPARGVAIEEVLATARDPDPRFYDGLPDWTRAAYGRRFPPATLARYDGLSPAWLRGDFDGDDEPDVAVPVRSLDGAVGFAVLTANGLWLIGATAPPGDLADIGYWFVTHDPNGWDTIDLGERCVVFGVAPGTLRFDCGA
ncbi:MAG: hypothetical protein ABMB14_21175 [Myxococcota bacterium]